MAETPTTDAELRGDLDDEDVSRYGMVRLTPLGLYGVRARMREAGRRRARRRRPRRTRAPTCCSTALARLHRGGRAQAEIETWLARRETAAAAARELLAAARGGDDGRPRCAGCAASRPSRWSARRPSPRCARCWTTGAGRPGAGVAGGARARRTCPQPDEEMVFWLTVDTIAAQLAAGGEAGGAPGPGARGWSTSTRASSTKAWRVDHPATARCWRRWAGCTRTSRSPRTPARPPSRPAPLTRPGSPDRGLDAGRPPAGASRREGGECSRNRAAVTASRRAQLSSGAARRCR